MNIKRYQAFLAVIENKTMSKAAEKLYTTQPNISLMIKELENLYNTKLFYRHHNQLSLTPKGRILQKHANKLLRTYENMNQSMLFEKPVIRIGSTVTVSQFKLHDYLSIIRELDNNFDLNIVVNNTSRIEELLLEDLLDFAFVEGEIQSPRIRQIEIMEDELIAIIGANYPLKQDINKIKDLEKLPWIRREQGSQERNQFEKELKIRNVKPNVVYRSTNLNNVFQAVTDNYGFAIVSKLAAIQFLENDSVKQLTINDYQCIRTIRLAYVHSNPIIKSFLKHHCIQNT